MTDCGDDGLMEYGMRERYDWGRWASDCLKIYPLMQDPCPACTLYRAGHAEYARLYGMPFERYMVSDDQVAEILSLHKLPDIIGNLSDMVECWMLGYRNAVRFVSFIKEEECKE